MKKNAVFTVLLLTVLAVSAFSQSNESPLQKNNVMLSAGFSGFLGGLAAVDYVLPIGVPMTVGVESGYITMQGSDLDLMGSDENIIPVLARIAWHPWFGIGNLDTYLQAKAGIGILPAGTKSTLLGLGMGIGGRYFFTGNIGLFLELGFDAFLPAGSSDKSHGAGGGTGSLGITFKF